MDKVINYQIVSMSMKKINIKIEGEDKPFEMQVLNIQTFATLKNKLYLTHEKIVDLKPFINGKNQITSITAYVLDSIAKYPEFVYLYFGSSNPIVADALGAKLAGLSDQNLKPDYIKNFTNPTTQNVKSLKLQDKLKKVELTQGGKSSTTSFRITDLSHEQLRGLFSILKIENGRYMDEKMQIITSNKQAVRYKISQNDFSDIIEDKGVSHFFQNQRITEMTREVFEQGFKDKQLRNKVPYLFAFSYEEEESYFQFEKNIQKVDNTYVQHCFPRGEVNLLTVEISPFPSLLNYFDNVQITYDNLLLFYRNFGQFLIKKFTVGLKRVCSQKIIGVLQANNSEQAERFATMAAGRIRQYMLESSNELAKGQKKGELNVKSDQQIHYDIKAIGGAIQHCQNVALWKESVNSWELWRIIAVNQVQRVEVLLPADVQEKIQKVINDRIKMIKQKLSIKKTTSTILAPKLTKSKKTLRLDSNFETLCTFRQKVYQILSLDSNNLVLIFIDKAIKFNLNEMQGNDKIEFRDPSKCFYEREPGYMTACVHKCQVYIATQYGIVKLNFDDLSIKVVVEGNWRECSLLISYRNNLYSNGWRGIYEINTKTGQYFVKIGGDWRFYTGTCIKNNLYLFYWNIYCLDLDSMIYSKIGKGFWNQFWGDFTYPTNDGIKIWQLYRNSLYCLQGQSYYQVQFVKNSVAISNFTSRALCFKDGCLYLSNFDLNEHLMKIPL